MSTVRVCAVMGAVLCVGFASGCSSGNSGKKDGSADTRPGNRDAPIGNPGNSDAEGPCTNPLTGATIQFGGTFTSNCNIYTCQGGTIFTVRPAPNCDAGVARSPPDVAPANRDVSGAEPARADASPPVDQGPGGNGDTLAGEAGRRDAAPPVDLGGNKDVLVREDTLPPPTDVFVPEDTLPPTPDVLVPEDTAPPITCTSESGSKYYAGGGVCFPCGPSLCVCDVNGVIVQSAACSAVDAQ